MLTEIKIQPKVLRLGPWGYNMSINNFYVVLSETKHRARIRDIGSKVVYAEQGGFAGREVPAFNENVNYKEYTVIRTEHADGSVSYRGKAGLHRAYNLDVVEPGQSFSFNHAD